MTSPPSAVFEVPVLLGNGVGADTSQRIPRKIRRDAISLLIDMGYRTTPNQAISLLHEFREMREDDARWWIADEFRAWFLSYKDPTGSEACRNVQTERGY